MFNKEYKQKMIYKNIWSLSQMSVNFIVYVTKIQ
jgi:hypothetical protein